jgi:HEAT repeat protein
MKGRLKRILIGTVVGVSGLTLLTWILIHTLGDHQRLYQKKPVRYWLSAAKSPQNALSNQACEVLESQIMPQLIQAMFNDVHDSKLRLYLIEQLNTLPGVTIYFSPAPVRRAYAAQLLGELGSHAQRAIPELIKVLKGKDAVVRPAAAWALGDIHSQPDLVIPLLVKCLDDPQDGVPESAAHALGSFGPLSSSAVPKLLELAKVPDKGLHAAVTQALKKIDPEQAAKAGIR